MNIATITSLQPDGRPPYNSANGLLYGFNIAFDNNQSGLVNSKSQTPPYRVGEQVGYEVTGKVGQNDKLKITRNPQQQALPNAAPRTSAPLPVPQVAFTPNIESIKPVFGATVGCGINNAIDLLTKGLDHDEVVARIINPVFWSSVWEVASDAIRVARKLEAGELAPSPSERAERLTGARKAPAGHPDNHPDLESALPF